MFPSQIQLKTSNWGVFLFDTGGFRSNSKKRAEIFYLPRAPETGSIWVSVGDRGSDIFSYIRRAKEFYWQCLLRVTQNRVISKPDGTKGYLKAFARSLQPKYCNIRQASCRLQPVKGFNMNCYLILPAAKKR